mgnify:CR=1 FL=1
MEQKIRVEIEKLRIGDIKMDFIREELNEEFFLPRPYTIYLQDILIFLIKKKILVYIYNTIITQSFGCGIAINII